PLPLLHYCHHPVIHSFPTRRSSDLNGKQSAMRVAIQRAPFGSHQCPDIRIYFEIRNLGLIIAEIDLRTPLESVRTGKRAPTHGRDRKSTRLNSSHVKISYAVFCLKK